MSSHNTLTICDFGTAPLQKLDGYQLSGFEITCKESDLYSLLRFAGDVRAVRGGQTQNDEETFHVMVKREEPTNPPVESLPVRAIAKAKSNIIQLCKLVNSYDKDSGGRGTKVRAEDFYEPLEPIINKVDKPLSKIDKVVDKIKQGVKDAGTTVYQLDLAEFTGGERAVILGELTGANYHAYCLVTLLKCKMLPGKGE